MSTASALPPAAPSRLRSALSAVSVRDALLIGGLAFVLRTVFVLVWGRTVSGPNDTLFYEIAAGQLANGDGFSTLTGAPTAHWPPGFPFLVSLGYRALGIHVKFVFVLNVALATATAVLLYVVATRMLGRAGGPVRGHRVRAPARADLLHGALPLRDHVHLPARRRSSRSPSCLPERSLDTGRAGRRRSP